MKHDRYARIPNIAHRGELPEFANYDVLLFHLGVFFQQNLGFQTDTWDHRALEEKGETDPE
jgi:hypothetical protein